LTTCITETNFVQTSENPREIYPKLLLVQIGEKSELSHY